MKKIIQGNIQVIHMQTIKQLADVLTKSIQGKRYEGFIEYLMQGKTER